MSSVKSILKRVSSPGGGSQESYWLGSALGSHTRVSSCYQSVDRFEVVHKCTTIERYDERPEIEEDFLCNVAAAKATSTPILLPSHQAAAPVSVPTGEVLHLDKRSSLGTSAPAMPANQHAAQLGAVRASAAEPVSLSLALERVGAPRPTVVSAVAAPVPAPAAALALPASATQDRNGSTIATVASAAPAPVTAPVAVSAVPAFATQALVPRVDRSDPASVRVEVRWQAMAAMALGRHLAEQRLTAIRTANGRGNSIVFVEYDTTSRPRLSVAGFSECASDTASFCSTSATEDLEEAIAPTPSKSSDKGKRRSLRAPSPSDRGDVMKALAKATQECNVVRMEALIQQATELRTHESRRGGGRQIQASKKLLQQLENITTLRRMLDCTLEEVDDDSYVTIGAIRRAWNLAEQAHHLAGPRRGTATVRRAIKVLHRALRTLAAARGLRSIFDSTDAEELEMANLVFGRMSNCWKLKERYFGPTSRSSIVFTDDDRRTDRRVSSYEDDVRALQALTSPPRSSLVYSRECLQESLTAAPAGTTQEKHDAMAIILSNNLSVILGGKPSQDCQRDSCLDAVVHMAQSGVNDEVYFQVMRQLTNNPSKRSRRQGWELFRILCCSAPPSEAMTDFVRAFLDKNFGNIVQDSGTEAAKACIEALGPNRNSSIWRPVTAAWEAMKWAVGA